MFDAIWKRVFRVGGAVSVVMAALLVGGTGCSTAPVTGRPIFDLVDDADVTAKSKQAFAQMKASHRLSTDRAKIERLQRVGERLAEVVFWDVPDAEWEFVVFEAPGEVNAFAMAGGKVGVYSGTFDVATTDAELAVIIAHEIAHVTARHVHEKLSEGMVVEAGGVALGVASAGYGALTSAAVTSLYSMSSGVLGLSFDRSKEREADRIGLIYMARAGYAPRAAIDLWEKIDQLGSGRSAPPEWLSTHPSHADRMARLYEWLPRAEEVYRRTLAERARAAEVLTVP